MTNIVTIDLDILLHKSLGICNEVLDHIPLDELLNLYNESHFNINIDLQLYNILTDYILQVIQKIPKENISFILNHRDMVSQVQKIKNFNITNIDFHHDISYLQEDSQKEKIIRLDDGNWVKYIAENNFEFKKYTWIYSEYSIPYENFVPNNLIFDEQNLKYYNFNNLAKITNYLIICSSPKWTTIQTRYLYGTWKNIVENFYKK